MFPENRSVAKSLTFSGINHLVQNGLIKLTLDYGFVLNIITVVVLEVDRFAFEDLQSHINIVDLLQAADGGQTELG